MPLPRPDQIAIQNHLQDALKEIRQARLIMRRNQGRTDNEMRILNRYLDLLRDDMRYCIESVEDVDKINE